MAGIQTVGWPGLPPHHYYNLRAKPLGWFQRHLLWFPFFKDTRPKFILTVSCVQPNVSSQPLEWFIMFENMTQTGHQILVPPMTMGDKHDYILGDRLLAFGGDTVLAVKLSNGGFHTLVSFWTLRAETALWAIILAVLSGFVGALFILLLN